jgi:primosomal protein N''
LKGDFKMAISSSKTRLQVTVSQEIANKVRFYADKMGVTTSALVSQLVGQSIMSYDKAYDLVDEYAKKMIELEQEKRQKEEEQGQVKGQLSIGEETEKR